MKPPGSEVPHQGVLDPGSMDPVARRIRSLRLASGLTLKQLARKATDALGPRVGRTPGGAKPATVSAPYVSLIETGRKVPDEPIAVALADALGEDRALYRAWVRARKRADLDTALAAAETLKRILATLPSPTAPPPRGRIARGIGSASQFTVVPRGIAAEMPPAPQDRAPGAPTRLRVPVIPEGEDPGVGLRPACDVVDWLRVAVDGLPEDRRARLDRPFAWRLGPASSARVREVARSDGYALVLRDFMPLNHEDVYAVRVGGRIVLSRVIWNGRDLLLLPAPGDSDFEILAAAGESRLRSVVAGVVMFLPREINETR